MSQPKNITVTHRWQVVDVRKIEARGRLVYEYDDDDGGWFLKENGDAVNLGEWLEAFDGKQIKVTIEMTNYNEEGAKLVKKEVP